MAERALMDDSMAGYRYGRVPEEPLFGPRGESDVPRLSSEEVAPIIEGVAGGPPKHARGFTETHPSRSRAEVNRAAKLWAEGWMEKVRKWSISRVDEPDFKAVQREIIWQEAGSHPSHRPHKTPFD